MQNESVRINTNVIQQFINQVKSADLGNQREVRLDIVSAKNLCYTLSLAMTRLAGNYEDLLIKQENKNETLEVKMDGGIWEDGR
jgi:hypothetical protein